MDVSNSDSLRQTTVDSEGNVTSEFSSRLVSYAEGFLLSAPLPLPLPLDPARVASTPSSASSTSTEELNEATASILLGHLENWVKVKKSLTPNNGLFIQSQIAIAQKALSQLKDEDKKATFQQRLDLIKIDRALLPRPQIKGVKQQKRLSPIVLESASQSLLVALETEYLHATDNAPPTPQALRGMKMQISCVVDLMKSEGIPLEEEKSIYQRLDLLKLRLGLIPTLIRKGEGTLLTRAEFRGKICTIKTGLITEHEFLLSSALNKASQEKLAHLPKVVKRPQKSEIVMEHITGRIEQRIYSIQETANIMIQICQALKDINELLIDASDESGRFVHRNISIDNLLIRQDGHIVLSEFGALAKEGEQEKGVMSPPGNPLTTAAEAYFNEAVTEKLDSWSLGVVMYQLITGQAHPTGIAVEEFEYPIDFVSKYAMPPIDGPKDLKPHRAVVRENWEKLRFNVLAHVERLARNPEERAALDVMQDLLEPDPTHRITPRAAMDKLCSIDWNAMTY